MFRILVYQFKNLSYTMNNKSANFPAIYDNVLKRE